MLQTLFSLIVLIAALVLLVNSWRAEKRLFAATALVVALTAAVISVGLVRQLLAPTATLDPKQVLVTLEHVRAGELGVRIAGRMHNQSDERVTSVTLRISALACDDEDCVVTAKEDVKVLLQIPAGNTYPFSTMASITKLTTDAELRWQVEPVHVTIY
jgi:hypothetical protein